MWSTSPESPPAARALSVALRQCLAELEQVSARCWKYEVFPQGEGETPLQWLHHSHSELQMEYTHKAREGGTLQRFPSLPAPRHVSKLVSLLF